MMVERSVIDQIKDRNNILEIISEDVELNSRHKGFCPFHEETKPSFSVEPGKQFFRCFGCGVGGDVIRFLQLKQGLSFPEALRTLAERVGITVAELPAELAAEIERQRAKTDMLQEAAEYYHAALTDEIKQYLIKKRGFKEGTISEFRLGYAEGGLREHLESKDYPAELCRETRLIREDGRDFFYRVVTIPYFCRGEVKLIRARTHPDQEDKVYFPLPGYSIQLFNQDALAGTDKVVITEGEFDAMILNQMGYASVGVPGVNSFREDWLPIFEKCNLVYLAFDGDESGKGGARKIARLFGEKARVVSLSEGQDVNDLYLSGLAKDDFDKLLGDAKSDLDISIGEVKAMPSHIQSNTLKSVFERLEKLDTLELIHYKKVVCEAIGMGTRDFDRALKEARQGAIEEDKDNVEETTTRPELSEEEEREAASLLKSPDLLKQFLADIEVLDCVGEDDNKAVLYLALTSRILNDPINIVVKGESSAGKSYIVKRVCEFFPEEDILEFTAMSPKALYHRKDNISHKVLIMHEHYGSEDADYSLRILQSEKKLVFSMPVKNENTNAFETQDFEVAGPIAYIETTTKTHLHPENETRSFEIFSDESEEQTERIFRVQNQRFMGTIPDTEGITTRWKNAQRLLKSYPVLIPYVNEIEFPMKPLRTRRDRPRFLTLIETSAVLHQFQRERICENGIEFICADFEDYSIAYHLGQKLLFRTIQGISPNEAQIIECLWTLAQEKAQENNQDILAVEITRREIEEGIRWERKTVRKYLHAADKDGCIDIDRPGQGKAWKIKVVKRPEQKPAFLLSPDELYDRFKAKQKGTGESRPVQTDNGQVKLLLSQELG